MYKIEISLGWEEKVVIETDDFNKIALIQEFIALQEDCGWGVEDEELSFEDEDGNVWYYDEELDEWIEWVEDEEEEEEEEDEEDQE